jgi:hypothetical protein
MARDVALHAWGCSDETNLRLTTEFLAPFVSSGQRDRVRALALAPPHDLRALRATHVITVEEPLGEILLILRWTPAQATAQSLFAAMILPSGKRDEGTVTVEPVFDSTK